jgi:hypothetical protein
MEGASPVSRKPTKSRNDCQINSKLISKKYCQTFESNRIYIPIISDTVTDIIMQTFQYKINFLNIILLIAVVVLILGLINAHGQYNNLYFRICYKNNTSICNPKKCC